MMMMTPDDERASICSQVEDVIKCAICWENPETPKVLPCQHTFCLRCILPAHQSDVLQRIQPVGIVQCPLCRNTHRIPSKGLGAFPTDHKANVLKDIVQRKRYLKNGDFCAVCKISNGYTVGTYFCVTCCSLLCSRCHDCHTENLLYKDHLKIPTFARGITQLQCADHAKQFIQHYCTDCEKAVCMACIHDIHKSHVIIPFVSPDDADMSLAEDVSEHIEGQLNAISHQRELIVSLKEKSSRDKTVVVESLGKMQEKMKALRAERQRLKALSDYHEKLEEYLNELELRLNNVEEEVTDTLSTLHDEIYPLEDYDDVAVSTVALQKFQREFSAINLPTNHLELVQKRYPEITTGKSAIVTDLQNIRKHPAFSNIEEQDISTDAIQLWRNNLDAYDVQFLQDGSKTIVCTGQALKWKLHFINFRGKAIDTLEDFQQYSECECRVVSSAVTKTFSITYRKRNSGFELPFATFHEDGTKTSGKILTSRAQLSLCSLALTRNNDAVFTFMEYHYPPRHTSIRCYSQIGDFKWRSDTSRSLGPQGIETPYYIIVDHLDRLIVSDYRGGKVSIFDSRGKHLLSFPKECELDPTLDTTSENEEDQGIKPSGICVDSQNNIFVAFPTHHVISKFNSNGDFLEHLMKTNGKPRGLSLIEDRYLAVGILEEGLCLFDLHPDQESEEQSSDDESQEEATGDTYTEQELEDSTTSNTEQEEIAQQEQEENAEHEQEENVVESSRL